MAGPWEAFANQAPTGQQGPWTAFAEQKVAPVREHTTSPAAELTLDFMNQGSAAGQRTTPNINAQMKNFISDDVHENDAGEILYRDPKSGKLVPTDQNKQVALRDPADGKIKVFARTADTNEGFLSAAGRLIGTGMATGAPAARASAPEVVQAATRSVPEGTAVTQAATRLADVTGAPVNVPLAISSDSTAVQRVGQGIKNIPVVGDQIPQATGRLVEDLSGAVQSVANQFGAGSGPNVANRIGRVIGEAADAETAAARNAAQRSDAAVLADWQRATDDAGNVISSRETAALQRAHDAVGEMSPQDMGASLIARLRAGEQEARATKDRLYGIAGNSDASVRADAVSGIRSRVAQTLEQDGRVIDGVLTPASSRMMDELQRLSGLNIENRAVGARTPVAGGEAPTRAAVSAQGIEQVRKRLNAMSQAATNDADRSAARQIIREFDNWQSDAFDSALFSGSDEALSAFRQARAANTEWRQRFGFNARDDADRIVNRIVTGEVTPQEVSNWLVGASQVGAKGVSSRLLTRIAEATGGDAEAMQAIRGGVWNRLSQATEGATAKAPERVASGINEFLNGSGRDVANRLFTAEQRGIMSAYADTLRRGDQARTMLAEVARNTKPQAMEVGIGPMQDLANTVLGRGGKTDEALFAAINAYAKSGGRGDIATLSRIMRAIPQQDKGDLAGAIVSGIGTSPRTGQFSTDVFASQWQTYTPQAKAILFGNAGAHRQALDDIATISTRLKEVGQRYGNPSGTAQTRNIFTLAGGLMFAPGATIPAALGGAVGAHILASPAGASSAARWMKSYEAVAKAPSSRTIAAYTIASRNLVNTARSVGGVSAEHDVLRAIQGPVQGRAQNEQPEPERVINR